ncbi:MAG: ABC transporter permease [Vicinamibacteraceae bacterium]
MTAALHRLLARVRALFTGRQLDRDLDDEVASHIQLRAEALERTGLAPDAALRAARMEFHGVTQLREAHRAVRGVPWIEVIVRDLRLAVRTLRRDAGFTTFALLVMGLGLGGTATVYSLVNALMLRPLPLVDAGRLAWIGNRADDGVAVWHIQANHLRDLQAQSRTFADLAGYYAYTKPDDVKVTSASGTERVSTVPVTRNFFPLLGVEPIVGRGFTQAEGDGNGPRAVLISHHYWQQRYGLDAGIVGRSIILDGLPSTIVGVLPASFDFGSLFAPGRVIDVFPPFPLNDNTNRIGNSLGVIGRLRPDATVEAAQAEMEVLAKALERAHPQRNTLRPLVDSLAVHVAGHLRTALTLLLAAVGVVMLIVCANLANLQLARAASRRQEMAVRVALGAGRIRLLTQAIAESLVLCGGGALLGLGVAVVATKAITSLDAFKLPLLSTVRVDLATLGVLAAMAIVAGVAIGIAPALQVPTLSPQNRLRDGARGSSEGRRAQWARATLVVAEITFACVLLVAAGLLVRSLESAMHVDLGFEPTQATALRFDPTWPDNEPARRTAYFDETLRLARATRGVEAAGLTDILPLEGTRSWAIQGRGQVYELGHYPEGFVRVVSDGYREAMGLRLVAGRDLTRDDASPSEPVVLVNESLARTIWPGQDPIGRFLKSDGLGSKFERRVVGVVADVRHRALESTAGLEMYIPIRQTRSYGGFYLVVRSSQPTAVLAPALRASLAPLAADMGGSQLRVLGELVDRAISPRRFTAMLLGGFAVFALLLASLGVYAVVAYGVSRRRQEFGIRLALGASPGDVQRRVLSDTLRLAIAGLAFGVPAAWLVSRLMRDLLFGVTPADPTTFAGMIAVLGAMALVAAYVPARQASRLDPTTTLRGVE